MDNVLKNLLESDTLDESLKNTLVEEWNKKLNEEKEKIREEVENSLREEFSRKFESDREKMVIAMDKFMTESISKELTEFAEDRKQVFEARIKLAKAIDENKKKYSKKMKESSKTLEGFVLNMLRKELREFVADRKALAESKAKLTEDMTQRKETLTEETAARMKKLEAFVISKLSDELKEFAQDKKELVEQRVRMTKEAKEKLDEVRKTFVKRSAELVEKNLKETLEKEFRQLHEDIKLAKQNHFGRKIFEAFAAEYMTSYLNEGSELKKLENRLNESRAQTQKAISQLTEHQNLVKSLGSKISLLEENTKRNKILSELLAPLGRETKSVMSQILEGVKTERLQETFKKHLPLVLNESRGGHSVRKNLNESSEGKVITGDRQLSQTKTEEITVENPVEPANAEVVRLRALAGIGK